MTQDNPNNFVQVNPQGEPYPFTFSTNTQRVDHYHHSEPRNPTVSLEVERNSRGINWKIYISGAESTDQAFDLMKTLQERLEAQFPTPVSNRMDKNE